MLTEVEILQQILDKLEKLDRLEKLDKLDRLDLLQQLSTLDDLKKWLFLVFVVLSIGVGVYIGYIVGRRA